MQRRLNDEVKRATEFYIIDELSDVYRHGKSLSDQEIYCILSRIINKHSNISTMFFAELKSSACDAYLRIARENLNLRLFSEVHGDFDFFVQKHKFIINKMYTLNLRVLAHQLKDTVKQIRSFRARKNELALQKEGMKKLSLCDNFNFIVFSEQYKKYREYLCDSIYSKIINIWLPYAENALEQGEANEYKNFLKVRIGGMPSPVADREAVFWQIVKYINAHSDKIQYGYEFVLFRRRNQNVKNVHTYSNWDDSRENVIEFYDSVDWMLIPYSENRYSLSASGISYDALYMCVPQFMYTSNCFADLLRFDVGIRGTSIEDLGEKIIEAINFYGKNSRCSFRNNCLNAQQQMNDSNILKFKQLELE